MKPLTIDHPLNHRRAMKGELVRSDSVKWWHEDPANGWCCRSCGCVSRSWQQADDHTALAHPERCR